MTLVVPTSNSLGDLLMTEWTVLRSVDQASLWNTMMTLVVGSRAGRLAFWQLQGREKGRAQRTLQPDDFYRTHALCLLSLSVLSRGI